MANTNYGVNANEAVKLWSRMLFRESLRSTVFGDFIGSDTNSLVQIKDDTRRGPGDRIRVTLRTQLVGDGVEGDGTLEGNEEALTTFTDDLVIDQLRHAVRSNGRVSDQRIPFSVRDEARLGLQDWFSGRLDNVFFNQLGGITTQSDTRFTGHNTVTAFESDNKTVANDGNAEDLSSTNTFDLSLLDEALEIIKTKGEGSDGDAPFRPIRVGGQPYFVCFLHPFQVKDMRTSTDTGQWLDIQKAALQGGQASNNPIFSGSLGVYNGIVLREAARVPQAQNSSDGALVSNTRRALIGGAQAMMMAFGRDNGPNTMTWVEEVFDYQNQLGVAAGMISGMKRTIFNSHTFSAYAIDTWAASGAN